MYLAQFLAEAGLLDLSLSFVAEVIVFVLMIAVLARWVYPRIIAAAEERQRQVAGELEAAEVARQEAEQRLEQAEKRLEEARGSAQEIIAGANKSAEQLRQELRDRAEEEAKRTTERARQEIEAERQKAVDAVRREVATLVVDATEKVVGETLDEARHRRLIDEAIEEVGGDRKRKG